MMPSSACSGLTLDAWLDMESWSMGVKGGTSGIVFMNPALSLSLIITKQSRRRFSGNAHQRHADVIKLSQRVHEYAQQIILFHLLENLSLTSIAGLEFNILRLGVGCDEYG